MYANFVQHTVHYSHLFIVLQGQTNQKQQEDGRWTNRTHEWDKWGGGGQKPLAFGSSYQNTEHFAGLAGFWEPFCCSTIKEDGQIISLVEYVLFSVL